MRGAHEAIHQAKLLPQYDGDGIGGPQGDEGTVMESSVTREEVTEPRELSEKDAAEIREKTND